MHATRLAWQWYWMGQVLVSLLLNALMRLFALISLVTIVTASNYWVRLHQSGTSSVAYDIGSKRSHRVLKNCGRHPLCTVFESIFSYCISLSTYHWLHSVQVRCAAVQVRQHDRDVTVEASLLWTPVRRVDGQKKKRKFLPSAKGYPWSPKAVHK